MQCLLAALKVSGLEKVVAESTIGAQAGDALGDLSVLHELERGLAAQPIPFGIVRAAFYMSNWDHALDSARDKGEVPTMFSCDLRIPMVAPIDLGRAGADFLLASLDATGIRYVEVPERYTSNDVADAFATALHREVTAAATPRDRWEQAFVAQGFSTAAARSYARMTAVTVDGRIDLPASPTRGATTLNDYIARLVARRSP